MNKLSALYNFESNLYILLFFCLTLFMVEEYLWKLNQVEHLAKRSKFARLFNTPFRLLFSFFHRKLIYPRRKKGLIRATNTFFDTSMYVRLPAGTDLYLLGAKTHDSEIRLARFMINHLKKDQVFLDIGAHFGYFSLLASQLVGDSGKVFAFEPSASTFEMLSKNASNVLNLNLNKKAISDSNGRLIFHEFPPLQSEYNTLIPKAYEAAEWFDESLLVKVEVPVISIDYFVNDKNVQPDMIKVDVEGAESQVVRGMKGIMTTLAPIIILEYVPSANNNEFQDARSLLTEAGYQMNKIKADGSLQVVTNIKETTFTDSENMVFQKEKLLQLSGDAV